MRKKRTLCLLLSILMVLSLFAVNVSAAEADDGMAQVACDPIWFEVQDLLDEAYELVEAVDVYTCESRMELKAVADSVDVISSSSYTVARLQNAIDSLVPIQSTEGDFECGCDMWIEGLLGEAERIFEDRYLYTDYSFWEFEQAYYDLLEASGEYERECAADALSDAISNLQVVSTNLETYPNGDIEYVTGDRFGSAHPYSNNLTKTWIVTDEGADSIELEFSMKTVLEQGYDYIYIYDGDNNLVDRYTGTQLAGKCVVVDSDTAKVKLNTDYSVTKYGFECTWTSAINAEKEAVIRVQDNEYTAYVGEVVTYTVELYAEQLFEDIQAIVTYDSDALEIVPFSSEFSPLPELDKAIINIDNAGCVKFNHTDLEGIDFSDEKVLVTLKFVVKEAVESEIDLNIEVMTILGDEDHYFLDGKPVKKDGIEIIECLDNMTLLLGDATGNGKINIKDATAIQKHICQLVTLNETALKCADADCDGIVTIKDATAVQKYIAGYEVETEIGCPINDSTIPDVSEPDSSHTDSSETDSSLPEELEYGFPVRDGYNTIVFSTNEWENAYLYAWGSDNYEEFCWPGQSMTYVGENDYGERLFYIMVSDEYTNFILNNGTGEQTDDLDMMGNIGIYLTEIGDYGKYDVGTWEPWFDYDDITVPSSETDPTETEPDVEPVTIYATDGSFESEHDYRPYSDITWIIKGEDAEYVDLHFDNDTYVEESYDYIRIYDKNDNLLGDFTGGYLASKTFRVFTDTAKVQLISDGSEEYYGFCCEYEFGYPEEYDFSLRGEFSDWIEGERFTDNGDGTFSITRYIEPGSYEFKIVDETNGQWLGNAGTITDTCENYGFRGSEMNCKLIATGGVYTFTVHVDNYDVVRLTVEYVEEQPAELITVYFIKPEEWNDAYLFAFYCNENYQNMVSWTDEYPGDLMTYSHTDYYGREIYSLQVPDDITFIKFSNGSEENLRTLSVPNADVMDGIVFRVGEDAGNNKWTYECEDILYTVD